MKRLFLVVIILFCLTPSVKAQETCDTAAWANDAQVYLDEFTAEIDVIDPNDIPGMTEFYSRIMDALHYYEDLETCPDLDTANGLMISVLNGMQDRLFYVMSTLARREGLQINASIVENSVQPRYDENLALLTVQLDAMASNTNAPSGLAAADSEPTIVATLQSSNANEILGPFDVEAGFYIIEWDIVDDGDVPVFAKLYIQWDDGDFSSGTFDLQGRDVFYLESGSRYANVEFEYAQEYTITVYSASTTPISETSISGTGNIKDVFGPFELAEGEYILAFTARADDTALPDTFVEVRYEAASGFPDGVFTEDSGDVSGQQIIEVERGLYYFKYDFHAVSEWEFSITPVG
jgi:hypothetical protein